MAYFGVKLGDKNKYWVLIVFANNALSSVTVNLRYKIKYEVCYINGITGA